MHVDMKSRATANSVTTYFGAQGAFLALNADCEVWFPSNHRESLDESIIEIDAMVKALGEIKTAFEAKKAKGGGA